MQIFYTLYNTTTTDPVLAHFLSPDPYIQSPENPLNHNRYAYCLFSPLQYVDPSGFFVDWVQDIDGNIYWDQFATSQATTKNGEKYLGKNFIARDKNSGYLIEFMDNEEMKIVLSEVKIQADKTSKESNWGIPFDMSSILSWWEKLGGIFGFANNGQGQENRIGNGRLVDLSPFTDNMPSPFVNNYKPTNTTPPITNKPQKVQKGYTFEYEHPTISYRSQYHWVESKEDSMKFSQRLKSMGLRIDTIIPAYK